MKKFLIFAVLVSLFYTQVGAPILVAPQFARAQVPVVRMPDFVMVAEQTVRDWVKTMAIILIQRLQNEILRFIRGVLADCGRLEGQVASYLRLINIPGLGSFCPKFIGNWQAYLSSALFDAQAKVLIELNSSSLSPDIRAGLSNILRPVNPSLSAMRSTYVPSDMPDEDFLRRLNDDDNIYGAYLQVSDRFAELEDLSETAAEAEGIANEGFESTKRCARTADLGTGERTCIQWETTKPGSIVKEETAEATKSDLRRLENCNGDITCIIEALFSYFLTQLLNQAFNGLLGMEFVVPPPAPSPLPSLTPVPTPTPTPIPTPGPTPTVSIPPPPG